MFLGNLKDKQLSKVVLQSFNEIPVNDFQTYKVFSAVLCWPHNKCVRKMGIESVKKELTI
jgi:hypothetical protein